MRRYTLASNRPEDLDDAVLDRMDELVEFPLPGVGERATILVGRCSLTPS